MLQVQHVQKHLELSNKKRREKNYNSCVQSHSEIDKTKIQPLTFIQSFILSFFPFLPISLKKCNDYILMLVVCVRGSCKYGANIPQALQLRVNKIHINCLYSRHVPKELKYMQGIFNTTY